MFGGTDKRRWKTSRKFETRSLTSEQAERAAMAMMPLHDDFRPISRDFETEARKPATKFTRLQRGLPPDGVDNIAGQLLVAERHLATMIFDEPYYATCFDTLITDEDVKNAEMPSSANEAL